MQLLPLKAADRIANAPRPRHDRLRYDCAAHDDSDPHAIRPQPHGVPAFGERPDGPFQLGPRPPTRVASSCSAWRTPISSAPPDESEEAVHRRPAVGSAWNGTKSPHRQTERRDTAPRGHRVAAGPRARPTAANCSREELEARKEARSRRRRTRAPMTVAAGNLGLGAGLRPPHRAPPGARYRHCSVGTTSVFGPSGQEASQTRRRDHPARRWESALQPGGGGGRY